VPGSVIAYHLAPLIAQRLTQLEQEQPGYLSERREVSSTWQVAGVATARPRSPWHSEI
jgi:hypothetical protein